MYICVAMEMCTELELVAACSYTLANRPISTVYTVATFSQHAKRTCTCTWIFLMWLHVHVSSKGLPSIVIFVCI